MVLNKEFKVNMVHIEAKDEIDERIRKETEKDKRYPESPIKDDVYSSSISYDGKEEEK